MYNRTTLSQGFTLQLTVVKIWTGNIIKVTKVKNYICCQSYSCYFSFSHKVHGGGLDNSLFICHGDHIHGGHTHGDHNQNSSCSHSCCGSICHRVRGRGCSVRSRHCCPHLPLPRLQPVHLDSKPPQYLFCLNWVYKYNPNWGSPCGVKVMLLARKELET